LPTLVNKSNEINTTKHFNQSLDECFLLSYSYHARNSLDRPPVSFLPAYEEGARGMSDEEVARLRTLFKVVYPVLEDGIAHDDEEIDIVTDMLDDAKEGLAGQEKESLYRNNVDGSIPQSEVQAARNARLDVVKFTTSGKLPMLSKHCHRYIACMLNFYFGMVQASEKHLRQMPLFISIRTTTPIHSIFVAQAIRYMYAAP
jgi:hypothetical protein